MLLEFNERQCPDVPDHVSRQIPEDRQKINGDRIVSSVRTIETTDTVARENSLDLLQQALRKLGHVSVFAFASGEFMVVGPGGERVRGTSLVAAMQEMLRCLGFNEIGRDEFD
ncbi:hypothetical protein [Paraburkholderia sp. J41]|uniref:hypothetical protein n=1 Tax=Paraburkholderia sp. J41 TaxID=2805433 RepID=UPI002AC3597A|nr:hypothetical protein [Paraburkholderia sp. J41]